MPITISRKDSPALHEVITVQDFLAHIISLQPPWKLEACELTVQELGKQKSLKEETKVCVHRGSASAKQGTTTASDSGLVLPAERRRKLENTFQGGCEHLPTARLLVESCPKPWLVADDILATGWLLRKTRSKPSLTQSQLTQSDVQESLTRCWIRCLSVSGVNSLLIGTTLSFRTRIALRRGKGKRLSCVCHCSLPAGPSCK